MSDNKAEYRSYFAQCMPVVKMSYFLRLTGTSSSTFSKFMKHEEYDYFMSIEKLEKLKRIIKEVLDSFT